MKLRTMHLSKPATLDQFCRDFSSPEHAKYQVDLETEAPALQQKIASLNDEERQRYAATFFETWKSLDPTTRHSLIGGVAGGAAGAGLAFTTSSVKDIGRLIGSPIGFTVGLTVLGVIIGALTPAALNYFTQNKVTGSMQTPFLWNLALPEVKLEFEGTAANKSTGSNEAAK